MTPQPGQTPSQSSQVQQPSGWDGLRYNSSVTVSEVDPTRSLDTQSERAKTTAFLQLARERFRIASLAEDGRRRQMLEDLKFRCGQQWDEPIERVRTQQGRPCLTINRIPEFLKHVTNNIRQARPEIKVDPRGDGADEEIAAIRQGLIRHILINSRADIAEDQAFDNLCTIGLGYIRVVDAWASPESMKKELYVQWVPNTFAVYEDPGSVRPDWTDGKFKFIVEDLSLAEFKQQYPDAQAASLDSFGTIGDHAPYWLVDGKVRVAEYWYIEDEEDTALLLSDGREVLFSQWDPQEDQQRQQQQQQDPNAPPPAPATIAAQRKTKVPRVKWAKITACDVLAKRDWPGKIIPVIPFIGNVVELDGQRLVMGMVRFARESQRMYNYMYSCFVEAIALAPKAPWVAEFDQIQEFRQLYEIAHTQPQAVLPYRGKSMDGQLLPPPQRQQAEPPIAAFVEGLKLCDANLKATFSIYDASLGQRGPQESGLAINSRKVESDTATYDWVDNFHRGMILLGICLDDLLQYFYNDEGREIQILREDLTQEAVMFNKAYQRQLKAGGPTKNVLYDLSKGKFSTSIATGPASATKRQEASQAILKLAQIYPPLMQIAGPNIIRLLDFPEKDAFAAQLEKAQPPQFRETQPGDEGGPDPAAMQQQLQQSQQLIQQLTGALNALSDKRGAEREKELWDTFRTQMTQETQLAIAQLKTGSDEAKVLNERLFEEMERIRQATEAIIAGGPQSQIAPQRSQPAQQAGAPAQAPSAPVSSQVSSPQGGGLPGAG